MKKTLLVTALFAGINAYAAIPSDINARADLVQKRNELTTTNIGKAYQHYLQASPIVNKIDVQIRDYKRGETGATGQTAVIIDWNNSYFGGEDVPVKEIVFNSTIDYSDAVAKEGKLAVIKSELDADTIAKALEMGKDSEDFKALSEIIQHVELTSTLLDDDKFEQHIRIKPVDAKPEDGIHITYEGFDYIVSTTDAALEHGYGKATLKSGKFEATNSQADNDGPQKITLLPFAGEVEFTEKGDLTLEIKPFELQADDVVIKLENLEGKGKNMVFDPVLAGYLGEQQYRVNNIAFASADAPEAVYVKSLTFTANNEKSGDLYKSAGGIEAVPVKESFSALTGGMSDMLGVQSVVAGYNMDKLSSELLSELPKLQADIQNLGAAGDDEAKQEEAKKALTPRVDNILAEAGKHGTVFKANLAINADPGNATLDAHVEFLKGSKLTFAELETATEADDPSQFIELLNKNVRFEVNVVVPKALVDAVGAGVFLEGNPYLPLEGNNYKLNLKNGDKGITLNGQAFPM